MTTRTELLEIIENGENSGVEFKRDVLQNHDLAKELKEKSLLIREERIFANVGERLAPLRTLHSDLVEGLPVDTAFVSAKALEGKIHSNKTSIGSNKRFFVFICLCLFYLLK